MRCVLWSWEGVPCLLSPLSPPPSAGGSLPPRVDALSQSQWGPRKGFGVRPLGTPGGREGSGEGLQKRLLPGCLLCLFFQLFTMEILKRSEKLDEQDIFPPFSCRHSPCTLLVPSLTCVILFVFLWLISCCQKVCSTFSIFVCF